MWDRADSLLEHVEFAPQLIRHDADVMGSAADPMHEQTDLARREPGIRKRHMNEVTARDQPAYSRVSEAWRSGPMESNATF
jgi:hypothetical protein